MPAADPAPYLAGLYLAGRSVVIIGAGSSVARRIHRFVRTGAVLTVVSPAAETAIEGLAEAGKLTWLRREYAEGDLAGAWYAMAATDVPAVNEQVVAEAESRRVFCVRADRGALGSAVTPAVGGYDGVQVGVLAGGDHRRSGRVRDELVAALTSSSAVSVERPTGVALVGGGPGDPDLITVRGARLLAAADVVVVDRLAPGELLEGVRADAVVIDASKIPRGRSMAQGTIEDLLVEHAKAGRFVVRLKGGDPYVFGRGFEEVQALAAAGVSTVVVPGVTSAVSAPALAGIPVTHRGVVHEFTVVSGHLPPDHPQSLVSWPAIGAAYGTVVVLMGLANAAPIARALIDGGRDRSTPVAVVTDASLPSQQRVDTTLERLGEIAGGLRAPAVIVIGAVVSLRPHGWSL